ncbi:MAG: hypothetical protein V2I27_10535 [Erythrobacter sp.]|nr:hypothetical protein [Erythrobacter sp.]
MIDPKWFVLGVGLGAFALAANYDMRLGIAAGVVLALCFGTYLLISLRLSGEPGQEGSNRAKLARRMALLSRNRRDAQQREASAQAGGGES